MSTLAFVFALLVLYQLKHFMADFLLQVPNRYMLGKFKPGWAFMGPLLAHVGVHASCTFVLTIIMGAPQVALPIALFDAVVHFFMDRIKASPRYMGRWKPLTAAEYVEAEKNIKRGYWIYPKGEDDPPTKLRGNTLFWMCLGIDQMVHHLTHYACIYFTLRALGRF